MPPAELLRETVVHEVSEYIDAGNAFQTAEEQILPTASWGVANTGRLGECNADKSVLRDWVKKQQKLMGNK